MTYCDTCPENQECHVCIDLIEGGALRKKLNPPINIKLYGSDHNSEYDGELCVISPVGMLIKTEAPFDEYSIVLKDDIQTFLSPVFNKGLDDFIAFDITKVKRASGSDKRLTKEEYEFLSMSKTELIDHLTEDVEDNLKDKIREDLKNELMKSELLDQLVAGSTFKYEKGRIKQLSGQKDDLLKEENMRDLMHTSIKQNEPQRDTIIDTENERYVDIHALPLGYQNGGFITFDVTDIVRKEKELLQEQWENYKEVISALTKGKLSLINEQELGDLLKKYEKQSEHDIREMNHLLSLRESISDVLSQTSIPEKTQKQFVLAVHEAATNVLKYADTGVAVIWSSDQEILIMLEDHGHGIKLKDLPKATLINGFSESATLGQGFNLMTQLSDQIYLKSDSSGTKVGLLINKS